MDRSRSSPGTPHVEETPSLYDMHAWPNEMINFCAPHAAVYMLYKKYSQDGFNVFEYHGDIHSEAHTFPYVLKRYRKIAI